MNRFAASFSIANGLRISNKAELDHFIKQNEELKAKNMTYYEKYE